MPGGHDINPREPAGDTRRVDERQVEPGRTTPSPEGEDMSGNNYLNLFLDAGINQMNHDKYSRCLDAVLAQEGITVGDIIGVGEHNDSLCVVHRQAIVEASERGMFNKRIELRRVGPVAGIARLRREAEGFKGRDGLNIIAHDASGQVQWKISWGLGGPDWVVPAAERESEHVYNLIAQAMDSVSDAPARPSVATATSKAGALMDWAADVVKAAGVPVTNQVVEEHAIMVAASIRMVVFLRLAQLDDLTKLYPGGGMPDGTPLQTFDDVYSRVVARVGSSQLVDREIDKNLASAWGEWVQGCRETYA
jgi:hypothetical protein